MIRKILFVDDDLVALKMGELMLKGLGYQVYPASGGYEALDILKREKVDLIFLDIMMPDIYGVEVLRKIKSSEEYADIPVIAQTGVKNQKDLDEIEELGVVGLLSKPYSKQDMKRMIAGSF